MISDWLYFISVSRQYIKYQNMNKNLSILAIVAILASAAILFTLQPRVQNEFQSWKKTYAPTWSPFEQSYREYVFLKNLQIITRHNADQTQTYKMAINQFSALTDDEFKAIYLKPKRMHDQSTFEQVDIMMPPINSEIDWTTQGRVSPVKNQGQCGSCWAFSAVGVLESFSLGKGSAVNLSEQQLVDCSKSYGNQGCNGGYNYQGLAYVKDKGITDSIAYPYTAKTQTCHTNGGSFKITSVPTVKGCTALANSIMSRPTGVSVDAQNWNKYGGGVFSNCKANLDHDVLLVGIVGGNWKIKNSWSTSWGQNGFIRLAAGNTCGICNDKSPWVE